MDLKYTIDSYRRGRKDGEHSCHQDPAERGNILLAMWGGCCSAGELIRRKAIFLWIGYTVLQLES
jgi:hypothetical protein